MNTIFNQCLVSITDSPDEDTNKVAGFLRVDWTELGNRPMVNIFEYDSLPERKAAMVKAMYFAAQMMQDFAI